MDYGNGLWQGTEPVCLQRLAGALEAEKLLKAGYTEQLVLLKNSLQASVAIGPLPCFAHAASHQMAMHQNTWISVCCPVRSPSISISSCHKL